MTDKELEQIRDRVNKATEGSWGWVPIVDDIEFFVYGENGEGAVAENVFTATDAEFISRAREYIPKLLAEVDRLRNELNGDRVLTLPEQHEHTKEEIKRLNSEIGNLLNQKDHHNHFVRNLDALVDSVRYELFDEKPSTDKVLDEVAHLITDLEKKVGEIT